LTNHTNCVVVRTVEMGVAVRRIFSRTSRFYLDWRSRVRAEFG
jgi:hypothetical protein